MATDSSEEKEKGVALVRPSTSVAAICPVIAPPSSSPVPDVPPVTSVGSSTALTVTFIS